LKALVRWIVCAVGFREAVDAGCVLLAARFPFVVLLGLLVFAAPLPDFPAEAPEEAALLLLAGFFVCSVAAFEPCVCLATPLWGHSAVTPATQATATAPRNLPQVLVTVSSLFQPTSSTLIAFQTPHGSPNLSRYVKE
jgi:hypothetical protein